MIEKIKTPLSGFAMLGFAIVCLAGTAYSFFSQQIVLGILLLFTSLITFAGIIIINPNESRVLTFFGTYSGTVKANGLFFVNPLYKKQSVSLRARNLNGQSLKVNDKMGNPIEIAAVIVWQVQDTAKATFAVDNYTQYVNIQSEAAVRHLAGSCPYDNLEDESATLTLRDGAEKVNEMLENELNERLSPAGIIVLEARISHLAYAPEIAGAMLQRQQATAVVAARKQIVEGAVSMVEMALSRLSEREIIQLDEERKAAMVSNLLVVLCAEKAVSPVLNTGTLYN
ncbi:SPFH domain-containing protein [Solitalea lacus]|uniref:SPFH domain-containing protein n=1 Tax=Solitalea lacus TaxID=2911172 RepID=UPI001EDC3322|nr:SPFH domain-containing protein [Solitalea lacus]UKJ07278.1 SPFH domain-containing protein [Solitalea lacus]